MFLLFNDHMLSVHRLIPFCIFLGLMQFFLSCYYNKERSQCWNVDQLFPHQHESRGHSSRLQTRARFHPECSITNALCTELCFLNTERKEAAEQRKWNQHCESSHLHSSDATVMFVALSLSSFKARLLICFSISSKSKQIKWIFILTIYTVLFDKRKILV